MVDRREQPGLADEALSEALVLGEMGREHLEREPALQVDVLRFVHAAHAAATEFALDPVAGQQRRNVGSRAHAGLPLGSTGAPPPPPG